MLNILKIKDCSIFFAAILSIASLFVSPLASAATYTVISASDGTGFGTLRWALNLANQNPNHDTVQFYFWGSKTISLNSPLPVIKTDLTINGPGANKLTIQRSTDVGTANFRLLTIAHRKNVTINGLTLKNGFAEGDGIVGGDPEIDDFVDRSLYVDSGGAILAHGGTNLTVNDSVINENSANGSGGAIFVFSCNELCSTPLQNFTSTLTINQTTFNNNHAIGNEGGAAYHHGYEGYMDIIDSAFTGNTASGGGGAVYIRGFQGDLNIDNSSFDQNTAGFGGGAIFQNGYCGDLTISNSSIVNNDGTFVGGGVYSGGFISYHPIDGALCQTNLFTMSNSLVKGNFVNSFAGGVYGGRDMTGLVQESIIEENYVDNVFSPTVFGGGMFMLGASVFGSSWEIVDSEIRDNYGVASSEVRGAGIYSQVDTPPFLKITRSTISGNIAGTTSGNGHRGVGAGIYAFFGLNLTNSTVSGNTSVSKVVSPVNSNDKGIGSAVYIFDGFLNSVNNTITDNTADSAAIEIDAASTVTFSNTIIANQQNTGINCAGAGMYSSNGYNIDSDNTCNLNNTGDQNNTDPLLAPLADNGGLTPTHELNQGSPAIDSGDCDGGNIQEDQRGVLRAQGPSCDIGAFEVKSFYEICSKLSYPFPFILDIDDFYFSGVKDSNLTVTLMKDPNGTSTGDYASIYLNALPGIPLPLLAGQSFSPLPITFSYTPNYSGIFYLTAVEDSFNPFAPNKIPFSGDYCIRLETDPVIPLVPTITVE